VVCCRDNADEAIPAHAASEPRRSIWLRTGLSAAVREEQLGGQDHRGLTTYLLTIFPRKVSDMYVMGREVLVLIHSRTAYAMGKIGMSVLVKGLAMDFERQGRHDMSTTAIWPAAVCGDIPFTR